MEPMLNELCQEAETSKRLLNRVPATSLSGGLIPIDVSRQRALHVASIPGDLSRLAHLDQFEAATAKVEPSMPGSKAVMSALNKSLSEASEYLAARSPDAAGAPWRLMLVELRSSRYLVR
jgi:hypothetical protein